eukprot:scaffold136263_cov40-Tisochrysis_lutea.AAC.2
MLRLGHGMPQHQFSTKPIAAKIMAGGIMRVPCVQPALTALQLLRHLIMSRLHSRVLSNSVGMSAPPIEQHRSCSRQHESAQEGWPVIGSCWGSM